MARSSTEAEYKCLAQTAAELAWVYQLLRDLCIFLAVIPSIGCDNISSISLASNPIMHSKMKHVSIDFHFVREPVQSDQLRFFYISILDQVADVFTKALHGPRFSQLRHKLRFLTPHELEGGSEMYFTFLLYFTLCCVGVTDSCESLFGCVFLILLRLI